MVIFIRPKDVRRIKTTSDATIFYTKDKTFVCDKNHPLPTGKENYFSLNLKESGRDGK